jgi:general stress protein YciG
MEIVMSIDEKTPTTTPTEPTNEQSTPATQSSPATTSTAEDGGTPQEQPKPRRRGFAAMDRDRVKEIASKGGRAAHAAGTAHQFSADEARVAGKKGGLAPHVRRGGVRRRPITEAAAPNSQQGQVDGR